MKKLFATILAIIVVSVNIYAQYNQQHPKLTAIGLPSSPAFGSSVSLSDDASIAVVGAWGGTTGATGQAVIMNRTGSIWTQGQTLVGSGAIGGANQGNSVAISGDGNTVIIGGPNDNNGIGAAWVFVKNGTTWTEQAKLVGTGGTGSSWQGFSVALSRDGNIAVIGGPSDNSSAGAAWIFTRSGNSWSQVGSKLVGSGAVGFSGSQQGFSVSISKNGSVIAVGAMKDGYANDGAVWVYRKSSSNWIQEAKVTGSINNTGASVALSGDGSRLVIGAPAYNGKQGGAVVVTYSNGNWTVDNNGNFLVGTLPVGYAQQGSSVSISEDGNTVVVGGGASVLKANSTDIGLGACWVFTRSGSNWTQQGNKYVGTGASGNSQQGASVAMSADGNTFITGGFGDNNYNGAVWVFSKTIPPTTGINKISNNDLCVYPNPTKDLIYIKSAKNIYYELTGMNGQALLRGDYIAPIDISQMPDGMYMLNMFDRLGNKIAFQKIVKQN